MTSPHPRHHQHATAGKPEGPRHHDATNTSPSSGVQSAEGTGLLPTNDATLHVMTGEHHYEQNSAEKRSKNVISCSSDDTKNSTYSDIMTIPSKEGVQQSDDESAPLLDTRDTEVYARRWYVLAVFSLGAAVQGGGWATWGPITQTAKTVFSWSDSSVALQPLWGNLVYILLIVPITWMMDVKGLRVSMLFSSFALVLGFSLRCITSEPTTATLLINVGQVLIGAGGSVPFSGVSLLAATWFPPNERATATAISSVFSYLGVALSFIVGPLIVPEPPPAANSSSSTNWTGFDFINITDAVDLSPQRDGIMRLLYYEAGLTGLLLLLVLVYFPAKPPLPPSRTASLPRTDYVKGIKVLFSNPRFWMLAFAYSVPVGTYGAFGGIMDIDLNPTGISQMQAGWLGFYATIGGCVAGLFASRVADLFMRRLKIILLVLFIGAVGSLVWFCLLVVQYIHFDIASLYMSSILAGVFINGAIPLFYEAACEVTYPVAEGITTGSLTCLNNVIGVIFFALLFVPGIGVVWINWTLLAAVLVAVPLLIAMKEHYARIDIDVEIDVPEQ